MTPHSFWKNKAFWAVLAACVWAVASCIMFFPNCWVPWKYIPSAFDVSFLPPADLSLRLHRWGLLARGPLVALAAVGVLFYWGGRVRRLLGLPKMDAALQVAFDFALGSLLLNLFWVGAGLSGLWRGPVVGLAACGLGLPALVALVKFFRGVGREKARLFSWRDHGFAGNAILGMGAAYLVLAAVHSLVPDPFYDSNAYHLALPTLWKCLGGIVPVPGHLFAQYPFGGEFVLMNGFWFASDEAAKAINVAVLGAAGLAFYGWAREEAGPKAAAFAAGCFWTFPILNLNVWNAQVEGLLALYFVLCLYSLRVFAEEENSDRRRAFWVAACLFGAGALAVKYVAVLFLGALAVAWLWMRFKGRFSAPPKGVGWIALGAAAVWVAPWFIRNAVWSGNPFAPYFTDWFGGDTLSHFGRARLLLEQSNFSEPGPWAFLTWPIIRMTQMGDIADFTGPFALILLPCVFFVRPVSSGWRMIWIAWCVALVGGSFVTHVLRFHAPVMALGFLLAAVVWGKQRKTGLLLVASLAASVSAVAILPAMSNFSTVHYSPAGMCAGRETRLSYIARVGESPYGILADVVRREAPPGARIMVVGDARTLHYPGPAFAQSVFDRQMLVKWAQESPDADVAWRGLRRMGIDYVVVSGLEAAKRGGDYALFDLSPLAWRRLDESLQAALEPVALDKWGGLLKVREKNDPGARVQPLWPKPFQLLSPPGAGFARSYQAGDWESSEKMLDGLILTFPNEGYWYEQRAHMRIKRNNPTGACEDLREAERLGTVHPESLEWQRQWGCGGKKRR